MNLDATVGRPLSKRGILMSKHFFVLLFIFGCGLASVSEAKRIGPHTGVVLNNDKVTVWNTYYKAGVQACRLEKATGAYSCSFVRYADSGGVIWCDVTNRPAGCQFDPYGPMNK